MDNRLIILISALMSMLAVHWVFMKILKVAKLKGLVDSPNARKLQKVPVPVLGGLAVFFGLLCGLLCASALFDLSGFSFENAATYNKAWSGLRGVLLPIILGSSIMLYIGAIDDTISLTPVSRLVIEIGVMLGICYGTGMCVDSFHGLFGVNSFSWWIGIPLTVFAGVGIINAFNMVDGVNGLSSGLCIVVSLLMGIFFAKRNDWTDASLTFCFAASLLPFLFHNVFGKHSRMFIGDAGTMVMGVIVSWFLIKTLSTDGVIGALNHSKPKLEIMCLPAMLLAITSVPIMDTLRVMTSRIIHGESPFKADKNHLHHKFIAMGVSHSITALSEMIINIIVVGVWYITYKLELSQEWQLFITIIAAVIFIWGTYAFLQYHEKNKTHLSQSIKNISFKTHLGHKNWWMIFQKLLDKGAYVDMEIILKEKFDMDMENMTDEKKDMVEVLNFLQGKKKVKIEELLDSTALVNKENIYQLLKKLQKDCMITILEQDETGKAKTVRISPSMNNL